MTFNDDVRSSGRVQRGGRGGMVAGGVGGLGLVGLVLFLLTGNTGFLDGGGGQAAPQQQQPQTSQTLDCTGEMANQDVECRMELSADALDQYWDAALPQQAGIEYSMPGFTVFSQSVNTGCGQASSAVGPFYCPPDASVFLDTNFFQVLETQLGAENAPLAQIYIVAHEWGHHIQNQTGAMGQANRQDTGPLSDGVRLELQADCYAGMFVGEAASTVDPDTGTTFLVPPTREEVQSALDAAAAVGDDHIQSQSGQVTNPESWTHGSSESRMNWFATGYEQGSMQACDTFATDDL